MSLLTPRPFAASTLAVLAGSALTLSGCSSFDERADVVDPFTGGPIVAEQSGFTTTNRAAPSFNGDIFADEVMANQPEFVDRPPEPSTPPIEVADEGSDGWLMVAAATEAEFVGQTQPSEAAPRPAAPINQPAGPGVAARLYNDILNTEIPAQERAQGTHTANIQRMSFAADGSDFDPSVSRDGRFLVYASTQHRPEADIYSQRIGSKVITRLTDDPAADVMPSLNPASDRIAYASNRSGNWDIWVMPSSGGRSIQVTSDPAPELHPSFSPNGQHVVYCRLGTTSGRWEIWVADSFGDSGAQFIGYGLFPEWSPVAGTGSNGSDRIVFQRSRERGSRTFSIWTIDYDRNRGQAGRETQIASDPNQALINPTWSPDGERIAFASVPNPEQWTGTGRGALPPSASIQMIGVDGRGAVSLTSGNAIDMMPTWGSTGRVFFVSDRSGIENLWALDISQAILAATGEDPFAPNTANNGNFGTNNPFGTNQPPIGPGFSNFVSAPTEP